MGYQNFDAIFEFLGFFKKDVDDFEIELIRLGRRCSTPLMAVIKFGPHPLVHAALTGVIVNFLVESFKIVRRGGMG